MQEVRTVFFFGIKELFVLFVNLNQVIWQSDFPVFSTKCWEKIVDISNLKKIGTALKNSSMIKIYFRKKTHNFLHNNYVSLVTLV